MKNIAKYTFLSLLKKKSYSVFIFFTLFNFLSWFYLKTLTDRFVFQVFFNINLSIFSVLSVIFLILWSYSEIGQDIKNKKIYIILGKNISRKEYFLGKSIGIYLSFLLNLFLFALLFSVELLYSGDFNVYFSFVILSYMFKFAAWTFIFCGINLFMDMIAAVTISVFIYFLNILSGISEHAFERFRQIFEYIVPSEKLFSEVIRAFLLDVNIPVFYNLYLLAYIFVYSFILVNIFVYFFEKREL